MFEIDNCSIKKAQDGDKYELERLVRENSGLIWSIVRRFKGRGFELEDLYQVGCLGFIKSIKRFDTSFEVKLSTYTVPYILGEIKRYIRDDGTIKISRSIKEIQAKIRDIQEEYRKKNKEASKPIESIDNMYKSDKGEKGICLIDKISTEKDEQEILTNKIAIRDIIKELPKEDKQIIILRFYKEKTQSEVAKILGVSQVQVSRIERKILQKMKKSLAEVC